jgi:hypothetical protein
MEGVVRMNDRTIGWEIVGDFIVSTAALPIPHHDGNYETMVFPQENGDVSNWGHLECRRYWTADEAKTGHTKVCARWANGQPTDLDHKAFNGDSLDEMLGTIIEEMF